VGSLFQSGLVDVHQRHAAPRWPDRLAYRRRSRSHDAATAGEWLRSVAPAKASTAVQLLRLTWTKRLPSSLTASSYPQRICAQQQRIIASGAPVRCRKDGGEAVLGVSAAIATGPRSTLRRDAL
jgi:hypothetical protein